MFAPGPPNRFILPLSIQTCTERQSVPVCFFPCPGQLRPEYSNHNSQHSHTFCLICFKREAFYVLKSISSLQQKCWTWTDTASSHDRLCKPIPSNSPVAEAQRAPVFGKSLKCHCKCLTLCMHELHDLHSPKWIICVVRPVWGLLFLISLSPCSWLQASHIQRRNWNFAKSKLCSFPALTSFDLFSWIGDHWELQMDTASLSIVCFIQGFAH